MTPHAILVRDITPDDRRLLAEVRLIVDALPDGLSCHDVCREIEGRCPDLMAVRGYFGRVGAEHSWLVFRDKPKLLLDPYPWACGSGPILVTLEGTLNPWRDLYVERRPIAP
jgi:hypothetical protein